MSATYSNNVVLNLQIGYGEVGGSSISPSDAAESGTYYDSVSYSALKSALQADAGNSSYQATADASLSATNPTNGGTFAISTADAKALGLEGANSSVDGYVGVSSALPFEFNETSTTGKYDAVGILQHEFTEVMGRVGSVGTDVGSGVYTALDLFRYTSTNNARSIPRHAGACADAAGRRHRLLLDRRRRNEPGRLQRLQYQCRLRRLGRNPHGYRPVRRCLPQRHPANVGQ